jgi:hypothetical protein
MAQKPTSLAAQLASNAAKDALASAKEDAKIAELETEDGKVWVRLQGAHYDKYGTYHQAGTTALLDADAIPKSAKVLTKQEAAEVEAAEE